MAANDAKVWRCENCGHVLAWHIGELLLLSLQAAVDANTPLRVNCRSCSKWQHWRPNQAGEPGRMTGELKTL